ncbi:MAG: glucose-1-phosphate cytidylyltransferase [Candidatus Aenigmatarchaeota archaeon]
MQVVILCGGLGTRLREETEFRPKPMVEIGGKPILWHIMKIYSHFGFNEFILCTGYKKEVIKNYFLNYEAMSNDCTIRLGSSHNIAIHGDSGDNWIITIADTGQETQTGGRVKRIEKYIRGNEFMLTYGDGLANIDIAKLAQFHHQHGKIGTVTGVRPSARFGELTIDADKVVSFAEKPQTSQSYINGGFFVFNRKIFDYIPNSTTSIFEREPLENLARDGQLMVYRHDGFWQCMDTFRELTLLNELWAKGAPWKVWKEGAK